MKPQDTNLQNLDSKIKHHLPEIIKEVEEILVNEGIKISSEIFEQIVKNTEAYNFSEQGMAYRWAREAELAIYPAQYGPDKEAIKRVISEMNARFYYLRNEIDFENLGSYLKKSDIHEIKESELAKANPRWRILLQKYYARLIPYFEKKWNWKMNYLKESSIESRELDEASPTEEYEIKSLRSSTNESNVGFNIGYKERRTSRKPNLGEIEKRMR